VVLDALPVSGRVVLRISPPKRANDSPGATGPGELGLYIDRYLNDFAHRRQIEEKARGEPMRKEELGFAPGAGLRGAACSAAGVSPLSR
jgi:hypothetical protein